MGLLPLHTHKAKNEAVGTRTATIEKQVIQELAIGTTRANIGKEFGRTRSTVFRFSGWFLLENITTVRLTFKDHL
jgi:hypothetical protein